MREEWRDGVGVTEKEKEEVVLTKKKSKRNERVSATKKEYEEATFKKKNKRTKREQWCSAVHGCEASSITTTFPFFSLFFSSFVVVVVIYCAYSNLCLILNVNVVLLGFICYFG